MIYTRKIQKAVDFATKVHNIDQNQTRSDRQTPYITHPLAVAIILARVNASEETLIAGILHDTIEDSIVSKKVTKEIIAKEFGERVATIVDDLTEKMNLLKVERKQQAINHIAQMSRDALLVKTADQLHNLVSMVEFIREKGEHAFDNHESTQQELTMWYSKRIDALNMAWKENPLLEELKVTYKEFLALTSLTDGSKTTP